MANNSISSKVVTAASVSISKPFKVYGVNTYTISTDFISWGEDCNYSLSDIAPDFGVRTAGVGDKVFTCGDEKISVYDFGLLFTVFTAMTSAQTELGSNFPLEETAVSKDGVRALWIGNDVIIYSQTLNLILPLDNADVQTVCSGERIERANFCTKDRYTVDRERVEIFIVDAAKYELLGRTRISDCAQKSYAKYFAQLEGADNDVLASWDTESRLGRLIASISDRLPVKKTLERYKKQGMVEGTNVHRELFVSLDKQYEDPMKVQQYFGNICYTDKAEIVIAVNFHSGLFVYTPCFPGDTFDGVAVDSKPDFSRYYDVTLGCERIMRFARTVTYRPLTAARLDVKVFNIIANQWTAQKLTRVSFPSSLGKVVIPESILESTFEVGFGADLFCMVPVGVVGEAVICKTATGKLEAVYPRGWSLDEAFYDVTEVVESVEC